MITEVLEGIVSGVIAEQEARGPFCSICKDTQTLAIQVTESKVKYGEFITTPCPECSVPIDYDIAHIVSPFYSDKFDNSLAAE